MADHILAGSIQENDWWKKLVLACARLDEPFQIHCWKDESTEIKMLAPFAVPKSFPWKHGIVFEGRISKEFLGFLCALPKPEARDGYNKMTPFFTIVLGEAMESCHYGTEIYLAKKNPEQLQQIEKILSEIESRCLLHRNL
ncbi:MAG: hypothetical protein Q4B50_08245 [Bacillota bacterium]|nr:hypothetical protein [Bacillota bacterium]